MKKLSALFCFVFVFVVYAHPGYSAEKVKYVGCGIVEKAFMSGLAKEFTDSTGIEVDIEGGGATRGIRDVASGKADIGGTCRHVMDVQAESGVKLHHVAWDALVVIVNKQNPVDTISLDQLKGVIKGRITDWGEVGGPAGNKMLFYTRDEKTDGVEMMSREIIFNDPNMDFAAAKTFDTTGPLEKAVEKDKWAIAITGISSAVKRDVKILRLNDIEISKQNIASGKYLLYRPLYLVTTTKPNGVTEKFIKFALSREGQEAISKQGTVNLREGSMLWRLYRESSK